MYIIYCMLCLVLTQHVIVDVVVVACCYIACTSCNSTSNSMQRFKNSHIRFPTLLSLLTVSIIPMMLLLTKLTGTATMVMPPPSDGILTIIFCFPIHKLPSRLMFAILSRTNQVRKLFITFLQRRPTDTNNMRNITAGCRRQATSLQIQLQTRN